MARWIILIGSVFLSISLLSVIPFCVGLILFSLDQSSQREVERTAKTAESMGINSNRWWYNAGMAVITVVLFALLVLTAGLTTLGESEMIHVANQLAGR